MFKKSLERKIIGQCANCNKDLYIKDLQEKDEDYILTSNNSDGVNIFCNADCKTAYSILLSCESLIRTNQDMTNDMAMLTKRVGGVAW